MTKIILVGVPRGGTSMVAAYLKKMGLSTVKDNRSGEDYPDGYNEPVGILAFSKACEKFRGNRYRLTHTPLIERGFWGCDELQVFHDAAFACLKDPAIDFVKVPDLTLSLEYILDTWQDCVVLGVWRRPSTSMQSFYQREFGRFPTIKEIFYAVGVWNMFILRLCAAKAKWPERVHLVGLEEFIDEPSEVNSWVREKFGDEIAWNEDIIIKQTPRHTAKMFWRCLPRLLESLSRFIPEARKPYFTTKVNLNRIKKMSL